MHVPMEPQLTPARTLGDYLSAVWRRKYLALSTTVLCACLAAGWSVTQTSVYRASTEVVIDVSRNTSLFGPVAGAGDARRRLLNEIAIVTGVEVRLGVQQQLHLSSPPPRAKFNTSTTSDVVTFFVESPDAQLAADVANAYIEQYNIYTAKISADTLAGAVDSLQQQIDDLQKQIETLDHSIAASGNDDDSTREAQRRELLAQQADFRHTLEQQQIDARLDTPGAKVVHPAETPGTPVRPTPIATTGLGLAIGALLGVALALIRQRLATTVDRPEDLVTLGIAAPLLTVVPVTSSTGDRPLATTDPTNDAVEAYRWLRTSVQFAGTDRNLKVLQVTSAMPGEGKTTTTANLAIVLANAGALVLIVDGDLRRPRIHTMFGLSGEAGLVDALVGRNPLELVRHTLDGPDVLPAGRSPYNSSELLSSRRMGEVLHELAAIYDFVIIDTPPVLPVSESLAVSRHADGTILVVRSGRTRSQPLQRTLGEFDRIGSPVLGIVLNGLDRKHTRYGYGAYGYDASK